MKKLIVLLAVLFSVNVAMAQFDFCLGPKIGYQTQSLSYKKADIQKGFKNNFIGGVFARVTISNFIIQPEFLFYKSGKVFNFDVDPTFSQSGIAVNPSITLNQTNMSLPIFLGYQIDGKLIKVRGNIGPVIYFTLKQDTEFNENDIPESVNANNVKVKNTTLGAAFNVGVDLWRLTLDINYSLGLSNVIGDDFNLYNIATGDPINVPIDKTRQNMFTVTLGFKFL